MRITRRQLRRIVETFATTAEEEALKVNKEAGISLVTDQAFWDERGISTGEELAKHLLASTYSDYYKDLHGIRPRWMADKIKTMSVEEIQTLIDDLDKEAEVMAADEKWEEENLPGWEDEMMAAVEANPEDIPEEYLEYETLPQQTGMGRRTEGIMRITRRQLRRIIRESLLREADTSVYEGDHDPIRIEIPALEKIAPEENFDGEKVWFSDSDASKIAEMLEDGPPDIERYDYDEEQYEEAEAKWDELIEVLGDGWYDEEREELAKNIRDGIKQAEDAGYNY